MDKKGWFLLGLLLGDSNSGGGGKGCGGCGCGCLIIFLIIGPFAFLGLFSESCRYTLLPVVIGITVISIFIGLVIRDYSNH